MGTHKPAPIDSTVTRHELLIDGSDTNFRNFIHGLLVFSNHLDECRTQFGAQLNITGTQYEVLVRLQRLQGGDGASVGEIARSLNKTGSLITIEANALNLKGLVQKSSDPTDGRRVLLQLTSKGENALNDLLPYQQKINDTLFDQVSAAEFDVLCPLIDKLQSNGQRAVDLMDYLAKRTESVAA